MMIGPAKGRLRRVGLAVVLIALHLLVVGVLLRSRASIVHAPAAAVMTLIARPTPHLIPLTEPNQRPVVFDAQIVAPVIEVASPPAALPSACDVSATLAAALQADPPTVAGLTSTAAQPMPAITAWNGVWSQRAEIDPLRRVVGAALSATRAECLDERLIGPRLIFVEVGLSKVVISFGSGTWTWRQVQSKING